jgi:hypothetical protein
MMRARTLVICAFGIVFSIHGIEGQSLLQYRNFTLGSNLTTISSATGMPASQATTVHQRPVLLQDLEWRPSRWIPGATEASTDPVEQIVFSFYDDQLFQIVVDYRPERTEGMTDADVIDAISAVYGATIKRAPGARQAASRVAIGSGTSIARWASVGHEVVLYRTSSYRQEFRLTVTNPSLDSLAQKAAAQALRLDEQEAPQRELARQKKERDDGRAAADKARIANKDAFRP